MQPFTTLTSVAVPLDIAKLDTGMIVFGVEDTMKAMEVGALEMMLLYENIEVNRYEIKNPATGQTNVYLLTPKQETDPKYFKDQATG